MSSPKNAAIRSSIIFAVIALIIVGGFLFVRGTDFWSDATALDGVAEAPVGTEEGFSTTTVSRTNVADEATLVGELRYQDHVRFVHRIDPTVVEMTEEVPAAPAATPAGSDSGARAGTTATPVATVETITTTVEEDAFRTITGLPTPGQVIASGDVLYETDSTPVFAIAGDVAAWREVSTLTTGEDVAQLQRYLMAGGWAADTLVDDGDWGADTTTAVQLWQEATGQPVTGVIALGDIWFIPTSIRITEVDTNEGVVVGDGDALFTYTSTDRAIEATLTELPDGLLVAETLTTQLPDRSTTTAVIRSIRGTDTGFEVILDVELPETGVPAVNNIEVTTSWVTNELVNALTLPPEALRRLEDGSYVVDVLEGDGVSTIAVTVLGQAGRVVAVDGVNETQLVVIP